MVATAASLELQATLVVTLPVDPSEKVGVAVNCCEVLLDIALFWELTVMLVIVLLLTVRPVIAITLPDCALMIVVPKVEPAVARPVLLMVAMFVDEELHVTWLVASTWVLLPNLAVALHCCVAPGCSVALSGETLSAAIVFTPGKTPPQPSGCLRENSENHENTKNQLLAVKPAAFSMLGGLGHGHEIRHRREIRLISLALTNVVARTRSCRSVLKCRLSFQNSASCAGPARPLQLLRKRAPRHQNVARSVSASPC